MDTMAWLAALAVVAVTILQIPPAWWFLFRLRRPTPSLPDAKLPRAVVVLCARGADASLTSCLHGVLTQDYPDYEVVVIVDHADDPAWPIAQAALASFPKARIRMETLAQALESCSLKCASQTQALSSLGDEYGVFAFVDMDVVPRTTWLRDLVVPLLESNVGCTAGVIWFTPRKANIGTVVRTVYNASAVVVWNLTGMAWGGSMAIRRDAFDKSNMLEVWKKSYCDDSCVHDLLRGIGMRVVVTPRVLSPHEEPCSLKQYFTWCVRQVFTARVQEPRFPQVVAHGLGTTILWCIALFLVLAAAIMGNGTAMAALGGALAAYWVVSFLILLALERGVRRLRISLGETHDRLSIRALIILFFAIPVTQALYTAVLVRTLSLRRICWRGIWYEYLGKRRVKMCGYQRYQPAGK